MPAHVQQLSSNVFADHYFYALHSVSGRGHARVELIDMTKTYSDIGVSDKVIFTSQSSRILGFFR
jgi:hypothetical protein